MGGQDEDQEVGAARTAVVLLCGLLVRRQRDFYLKLRKEEEISYHIRIS